MYDTWRVEHADGAGAAHTGVAGLAGIRRAVKHAREVEVRFVDQAGWVPTGEGQVWAEPGDAVLHGAEGDQWCVGGPKFGRKYAAVPPTTAGSNGRYRSLPITVEAVCMDEAFTVQLGDGRSVLRGHPGDWLVDYGDGSLGIVAAHLFDRLYQTTP